MKKEHYRDYATAAYRIRARLGSAREYAAKIWDQAMAQNPGRRDRRAAWETRRKPP